MESSVIIKVVIMLLVAIGAAILIIRNQKYRLPLQIVLSAAIILLGYWIYESIMDPIRFDRQKEAREQATIQRLKDIRTAQFAYRSVNNSFAPTFDTLFQFLETGKLPMVLKIGEVDSLTEAQALKLGLIVRDTTFIGVADSIFKDKPIGFDFHDLRFVPFTDKMDTMFMDAGEVERSGIVVPVFTASVKYRVLLRGLNEQYILNLVETREQLEKFPGVKVGSMEESTTDGNWE